MEVQEGEKELFLGFGCHELAFIRGYTDYFVRIELIFNGNDVLMINIKFGIRVSWVLVVVDSEPRAMLSAYFGSSLVWLWFPW